MLNHLMLHCLSISATKKRSGRCPHCLLFLPLPRIKAVRPLQTPEQKISCSLRHFCSTGCRCRNKSEKNKSSSCYLCVGSRNWQSQLPHRPVSSSTRYLFERLPASCEQLHRTEEGECASLRGGCASGFGSRALFGFSAGAAEHSSDSVLPPLI